MSWQAKSRCPEHHRAAVERIVHTLPEAYLLPPSPGEIFEGLDPAIAGINWQPFYSDEGRQAYTAPTQIKSSAQILTNLREQMEPEERARFDRQVEVQH
jgi:hypothetical protein